MVEQISSQQAYINYVMKRLPNAERGTVHTMQKGDNLWNLAKKALNNENASNQQISDYMLLIAKVNNLNTVEKMNGLKVSDKIYMPEVSAAKAVENAAVKVNKKELTSAEKSMLALKELIVKDKTVSTERAYPAQTNLYHVYNSYTNPETGYHTNKHPLMSFKLDNQGKLKYVTFKNDPPINQIKYDFEMDSKGNIIIYNHRRQVKCGQLDKKDVSEIRDILEGFARNAKMTF